VILQYKPRSRAAKWRRNLFVLIFPSVESTSPAFFPLLTDTPAQTSFSSALSPRKLVNLSGSCVGADLGLDTDTLSMGIVVVNTTVTKRFKLTNTGDVACTYSLVLEKLRKDLKLFPVTGFLASGESATIDATFSPASGILTVIL
jgi:hypothetical protein